MHHSIEPPDGSEEFRDQLAHEVYHWQYRQLSRFARPHHFILPIGVMAHHWCNRVRIQFLQVNWMQSAVEGTYNGRSDLTPDWIIPRTKGEDERRFFGQHNSSTGSIKVTTTFLLFERSASISLCMYTYLLGNLDKTDLRNYSMATYIYGYTTRMKHAYGERQYYKRNPPTEEDYPTKKHSNCHQPLHEWRALTENTPYPPIESHLRSDDFRGLKWTYSGDTLFIEKYI